MDTLYKMTQANTNTQIQVAIQQAFDEIASNFKEKVNQASSDGHSYKIIYTYRRSDAKKFNGFYLDRLLRKEGLLRKLKTEMRPFSIIYKDYNSQTPTRFTNIIASWSPNSNRKSQ